MRDKTLTMRLSAEEWARFEIVAEHYGLPVPFLIRMLVKKEETAIASGMPSAIDSRWEALKREAISLLPSTGIPRLRASFDERTHTIVLSDGKVTRLIRGGESAWFALASWPGSQLVASEQHQRDSGFSRRR
jgi:hypothetical protein